MTYRLGDDFYSKLESFTSQPFEKGLEIFSEEFKNIDSFYKKASNDKSSRDDREFRCQPRRMYLLEALNFQVYDDIDRDSFNKAKDTVVIVPQCLALMQSKCKRKRGKYGKICGRCVPNCQIWQITDIAAQFGVEVYFSKRKLERQLTKIKRVKPSLSVIGISCILTLASGMRTAQELGVPARGVFLNFTGCEHWSDNPFSTETSIARLHNILKEKYGIPDSPS